MDGSVTWKVAMHQTMQRISHQICFINNWQKEQYLEESNKETVKGIQPPIRRLYESVEIGTQHLTIPADLLWPSACVSREQNNYISAFATQPS